MYQIANQKMQQRHRFHESVPEKSRPMDHCFCCCWSLLSIIIPSSVTIINAAAFSRCSLLRNVVISSPSVLFSFFLVHSSPSILYIFIPLQSRLTSLSHRPLIPVHSISHVDSFRTASLMYIYIVHLKKNFYISFSAQILKILLNFSTGSIITRANFCPKINDTHISHTETTFPLLSVFLTKKRAIFQY